MSARDSQSTPLATETVTRHRPYYFDPRNGTGQSATMRANSNGGYVEWADYVSLFNECARLRAIVERNKTSATHRLHNLCDGLAEDADKSPFTREEWERVDRQTVHMQNQLRQIADLAARGLKHVDDLPAPEAPHG